MFDCSVSLVVSVSCNCFSFERHLILKLGKCSLASLTDFSGSEHKLSREHTYALFVFFSMICTDFLVILPSVFAEYLCKATCAKNHCK